MSIEGPVPAGEHNEDRSNVFESRHAAIIARTLRWADDAAARLDYAEALRWIETVRSLGEALPEDYEEKRRAWLRMAASSPCDDGVS